MEGVLALSHSVGNAALTELAALRGMGPEEGLNALPAGSCGTAPLEMDVGEPLLAAVPGFGGASSAANAAPLAL